MGMTPNGNGAQPQAGSWPIATVASGENILASQYNELLQGVQIWPGPVNAASWGFNNVGSQLWAGPVNAGNQTISHAVLDSTNTLPPATASYVGGVKASASVGIAADGTLAGNLGSCIIVTSNYQMLASDYGVLCSTTALTAVTLPVSPLTGQVVYVANYTGQNITLSAATGQMISGPSPSANLDNLTSVTLQTSVVLMLQYDAANKAWRPVNNFVLQPDGVGGTYYGWLNPATASLLGGVKIGSGLNVAADGTISNITGAPQVNSDWNASSGVAQILHQPPITWNGSNLGIAGGTLVVSNTTTDTLLTVQGPNHLQYLTIDVPTSGSPTISTVTGVLDIQGGLTLTGQLFVEAETQILGTLEVFSPDESINLQISCANGGTPTLTSSTGAINFPSLANFYNTNGALFLSPNLNDYLRINCANGGDPVLASSTGALLIAAGSTLRITDSNRSIFTSGSDLHLSCGGGYIVCDGWVKITELLVDTLAGQTNAWISAANNIFINGTDPSISNAPNNSLYFYIAADNSLWASWKDSGGGTHTFKISG